MNRTPTVFTCCCCRANVLPYYCLSWVITWCSHDIDDFSVIPRLFDLFLSSNPLMPVYFAAAIVLSHKEELLQQECENSAIHTFLSKLPQKPLDVEALIVKATQLEVSYPPIQLQRKAHIGLDETSSVNTWGDEKSVAEARDQARKILRMEPSERRPLVVAPMNSKQEQRMRQMIAIVAAVGIGVAAAALASARYI
jgi:TBC1 domain family member 20